MQVPPIPTTAPPVAPPPAAACPSPAECLLPQPLLPASWMLWALWAMALLLPLLAWGLSTLAIGPGARPRSGKGAAALGTAVLALGGLVLGFRLLSLLVEGLSPGPFAWLEQAGLFSAGKPSVGGACCVRPRGTAAEAMALLASLHGYLLALVALVVAARKRGEAVTQAFRIPFGAHAGWVLLGAAVVLVVGALGPLEGAGRGAVLLDALGFLPVACVALALWARAHYEPEEAARPQQPQAPLPPRAAVDVPGVWRQVGALANDARPLFSTPGGALQPTPGLSAELWWLAGAAGPSPGALDEAARLFQAPFQAQLVGDLPDPTERVLLTAMILRAVLLEGVPVLVITEDTRRDIDGTTRSQLRDAVEAAVRASGAWSCGPLVVGERELREAIAGRRFPAVAFLDVGDLSSQGIRAFARSTSEDGALWARSVGLVVVPQVDRGSGLAVTHRMHTLRRLGLSLRAAGSRWSVLATGFGGIATRSLLEQIFPGFSVREVPFAPRASAQVLVWTVADGFAQAPGAPWVRRATEPLIRAGLQISVGDPMGSFDLRGLEAEVGKVSLVRDVALGGDASASKFDDTWLLASFRAMPNRIPTADGLPHHALWGIETNPVVRFLLRSGSLAALAQQGRVPAPRPMVGYGNRLLARAHLNAALREGEQDIESLSGIFGRSLVEQIIGEGYQPERHVVRAIPSHDGLRRVGLAPAFTSETSNPLRNTVTETVVKVVNRHGGRHLADVDRVVAETRFYPGRVFVAGTERFEVPLHAFDAKRGEIQVEAVDEGRPLTLPILALDVADANLTEAPHDVRSGKMAYALAGFEMTAREQVSGFRDAQGRTTTYAPVGAQYRTRMRGIFFPGQVDDRALAHLARSVEGVLLAHLLAAEEDLYVVPLRAGTIQGFGAGIGVVDRYVQGMGAAEALDATAVEDMLVWVRSVLSTCSCKDGCSECSAPDILAAGPNKQGVLRLLGA